MELIKSTLDKITAPQQDVLAGAQDKLDNLTKPLGSLGKLETLAKQICGITGSLHPRLEHKVIFTFAGDHGVTAQGISPYPKEVTAQMVYNFLNGGAAINVLARHAGARVVIADLGVASDLKQGLGLIVRKVNYGTRDFTAGPAMNREEALKSVRYGIEIFEQEFSSGINIAGTGEMGIGNTTSSSAITAVLTGSSVEAVTGRGAGLNDKGLQNKVSVIKKAIKLNAPDSKDPFDVLAKLGGFEIGGLCGVILAASARKVPLVIDGFISGAAALLAYQLCPACGDYMIAAHNSVESGHKAILEHIGIEPLLDLGLRLGEGTGAALGIGLADASIKLLEQMATFSGAKVSQKKI